MHSTNMEKPRLGQIQASTCIHKVMLKLMFEPVCNHLIDPGAKAGWKPDTWVCFLLLPHTSKLFKTLGTLFRVSTDRNNNYSGFTSCCRIGAGFPSLGTIGSWGQISLRCGDCPVRGRMLSSITGLCPVEPVTPSSTHPSVTTKKCL